MRVLLAALLLPGASAIAASATPIYSETLPQAEVRALETSATLKASEAILAAAEHQADASKAALFPRLTLDGAYSYQTHVTNANIASLAGVAAPPGLPNTGIDFGTHNNFNVGSSLTYTLFDAGQARSAWRSSLRLASARGQDEEATRRQLILNLRIAYFNVQYLLESLALTADSLKLVQAQNRDVQVRFRAGASSQLDAVNARRQVLQYQLTFRQAQNSLDTALRALLALTGEGQGLDTRRAVPPEIARNLPDGVPAPTLIVGLDSIEQELGVFGRKEIEGLDPLHPQLQSLEFAAESQRHASEASLAMLWPRISTSVRSEFYYPDLVNHITVQQNIFSVTLSMPLFEAGLSRNQAAQNLSASIASERQREQTLIDLTRNWHSQRDLLESLRQQLSLSDENARQAEIASKLTYQSYRAGSLQYLDVVSADVRRLEAQVSAANVRTQMLSAMAQLDFLGASP